MTSVNELEAEVAATRNRLNTTIDRIQDKLTVSGIVDEFMGQAGVPRMASGHDFVFGLLRRHPVPVMVAAAGIGVLLYRMSKRERAHRILAIDEPDRAEALLPRPDLRASELDLPFSTTGV